MDPLTAMFATLRDVAPGQECQVSLKMFDGRRATRLTLGGRQAAGDKVTCAGEYRRVAGFSPEDMAEKTRFPFHDRHCGIRSNITKTKDSGTIRCNCD